LKLKNVTGPSLDIIPSVSNVSPDIKIMRKKILTIPGLFPANALMFLYTKCMKSAIKPTRIDAKLYIYVGDFISFYI